MSVIIRLQNLPWSANALDIRGFFRGLGIPEGGVHIVGGENGDAFIAFSTDEDARQAMMLDGGKLKEIQVRLLLSSRAEMQKVIETARQSSVPFALQPPAAPIIQAPPPPQIQLQPPIITTSLSGILSQQLMSQSQAQQSPGSYGAHVTATHNDLMTASSVTHSTIPQQIQNYQQQKSQPVFTTGGHAGYLSSENPIEVAKELGAQKAESVDKRRDSDRRDRNRKSRSRSRDRRRSRSRSRDRNRRRRNRSRSRSRDRDRRRRSRRSSSHERSRDSSHERSRDNFSRDRNSKTNDVVLVGGVKTNPGPTNIWDTPTATASVGMPLGLNSNLLNPLITNSIQTSTMQPKVYSSDDLNQLQKLDTMRNPVAFGTADPPTFSTNSQFSSNPMPAVFSTNNTINAYRPQQNQTVATGRVDGKCVKIAKLDTSTGYGDIRRFFGGLPISQNGIKMINDATGRRTGIAYIRFMRFDNKRTAIQRSGQDIREARVEVTHISEDEFETAVDSFRPYGTNNSSSSASYRHNDRRSNDDDDDDYRERGRDRDHTRYRERDRDSLDRDGFDSNMRDIIYNNRDPAKSVVDLDDDDDENDDLQIILDTSAESNKLEANKQITTTLSIKDTPPFVTEQDIMKIFSNYTLLDIILCKTLDGSKVNEAIVKFHQVEDARAALNDKSRHIIGYKKLMVTSVDDEVYARVKKEYEEQIENNTARINSDRTSNVKSIQDIEEEELMPPGESNKIEFPTDPRQNRNNQNNSNNQFESSNSIQNPYLNAMMGIGNTNAMVSPWQQQNNENPNNNNGGSFVRLDPRLNRMNANMENSRQGSNDSFQSNSRWSDVGSGVNQTMSGQQMYPNMNPAMNNQSKFPPYIRSNDPRARSMYSNVTQSNDGFSSAISNDANRDGGNDGLEANTNCVMISNLEEKTTDRDIIDFFSTIGLIPIRVHLLLNTMGEPSGDCFCEFGGPDDAKRACTKTNSNLGMNIVNVDLISSEKVESILSSFKNNNNNLNDDDHDDDGGGSSRGRRTSSLDRNDRGGYDRDGNRNQFQQRNNNYGGNSGSYNRGGNNFNRNDGGGSSGYNNRNNFGNNNGNNNNFNNNRGGRVGGNNGNSWGGNRGGGGNQRDNRSGGGGNNNYNNNGSRSDSMSNNNSFGDSCIVALENVPYRAGPDEIIDFFDGFELNGQNIMRRYNDNGTPTGDARVCFRTPMEAKRAVSEKRHGKIQNRTIYLKLLGDM